MNIGTLQGRLTPSRGRGIQFFPSAPGEWEKEFEIAHDIGIAHLEWVWDAEDNPLLQLDVRAQVKEAVAATGVPVRHTDLQFLTKMDFANCPNDTLERICEAIADIDGRALDLPLLEGSTLLDGAMRSARLAKLATLLEIGKKHGVGICLETDLPPTDYAKVHEDLPSLMVVYDSGNSAHAGYDVAEEWDAYAPRIANVQIKDRPKGGTTVPLGTGGTDFSTLFRKMKEARYTGLVTLQAARGEDGKEAETVKGYMEFVHQHAESV